MVSLIKGNKITELSSIAYSLKSKIGGFLSDDTDRSNMKLYIMNKTYILFYAVISTDLTGNTTYKVEIDNKSNIKETEVDLEKLYKNIDEFHKDMPDVVKILLDTNYEVFAMCDSANDYIPYKLDKRELIEANLNTSYVLFDEINKNDSLYFICAFPDILFSVDKYTALNYVSILLKGYVETRFMVSDKKKLENKSIISFPAFQFFIYHIKSLLNASFSTNYALKNYFDTMSKMNLLPHVPVNNWWIEENELVLTADRLVDFVSKKETIIDKVKENLLNKVNSDSIEKFDDDIEISCPYIPDYYTHVFYGEDLQILDWKDFLKEYTQSRYTRNSTQDFDFYFCPVIILPTENIANIDAEDIIFLGYDCDKFYVTLYSKENSKELSKKEQQIQNELQGYFYKKFGCTSEITFDVLLIDDNNLRVDL